MQAHGPQKISVLSHRIETFWAQRFRKTEACIDDFTWGIGRLDYVAGKGSSFSKITKKRTWALGTTSCGDFFGLRHNVSSGVYNDTVKAIRFSANIDNNLSLELLTRLVDLTFGMVGTYRSGKVDTQEIKYFFQEAGSSSFCEVGNTSVIAANNIFSGLDLDSIVLFLDKKWGMVLYSAAQEYCRRWPC